jgi:hypothetical protein
MPAGFVRHLFVGMQIFFVEQSCKVSPSSQDAFLILVNCEHTKERCLIELTMLYAARVEENLVERRKIDTFVVVLAVTCQLGLDCWLSPAATHLQFVTRFSALVWTKRSEAALIRRRCANHKHSQARYQHSY